MLESGSLQISKFLVLPAVGRYGRAMLHQDPIQAALAEGKWKLPAAGDQVLGADGVLRRWKAASATPEGKLPTGELRGGYASAVVQSDREQVVLLQASGHAAVVINGVPRAGDPYQTRRTLIPSLLKQGTNEFLFHLASGTLESTLVQPAQDVFFDARDATLPTLPRGDQEEIDASQPLWLSLLLVNCRKTPLQSCVLRAGFEGQEMLMSSAESVPPLGVRKIRVPVTADVGERPSQGPTVCLIRLADQQSQEQLAEASVELPAAPAKGFQIHTFRSRIDSSVQAYALKPAARPSENTGLLVSLHDVGETIEQHAMSFPDLPEQHVLIPLGRRVEGCDWEGWATFDAIEACDDAQKHVEFAANRQWLIGQGGGGHGALRVGTQTPARWAALAVVDPWLDFALPHIAEVKGDWHTLGMIARMELSNRLGPKLSNLTNSALRIRWSEDSQRTSRKSAAALADLRNIHPDFVEETLSLLPAPQRIEKAAASCVSRSRTELAQLPHVDITCYEPGPRSSNAWLTIEQQFEQGRLSRAYVHFDNEQDEFRGLTANVAALSLSTAHLGNKDDRVVSVVLDGQLVGEFESRDRTLLFVNEGHFWHLAPLLPRRTKQARRSGGFLRAWENNCLLVYGTLGDEAENTWALAKARFDAETLLVRANVSLDVVSDRDFLAHSTDEQRNVLLYGNADTNAAWPKMLSSSPVQVRRGSVSVEIRQEKGDDLACLLVQPRPRSPTALVGAVSGTGIAGMRATDRVPYFVHGNEYPDFLLFTPESLRTGYRDVRAIGYFGLDWNIGPDEIVWRDGAL